MNSIRVLGYPIMGFFWLFWVHADSSSNQFLLNWTPSHLNWHPGDRVIFIESARLARAHPEPRRGRGGKWAERRSPRPSPPAGSPCRRCPGALQTQDQTTPPQQTTKHCTDAARTAREPVGFNILRTEPTTAVGGAPGACCGDLLGGAPPLPPHRLPHIVAFVQEVLLEREVPPRRLCGRPSLLFFYLPRVLLQFAPRSRLPASSLVALFFLSAFLLFLLHLGSEMQRALPITRLRRCAQGPSRVSILRPPLHEFVDMHVFEDLERPLIGSKTFRIHHLCPR
mmetsp:Transcript_30835/g.62501  ORF Transcript_30835/g.62501 Transcript_30835/m.62501 type:complete len:282 (-) Transcript_30835:358-1203(-)